MKRRCLILFFILISCLNGFAQDHYIDSLRRLVKTEKKDTGMVRHMQGISADFERHGDYDSALLYGERSMALAEKLDDKKGTIFSNIDVGNVYFDRGNYLKALEFHSKAMEISQQVGDKKGMAFSYTDMAINYYSLGNYTKALDFDLKSLTLAQEIGNKSSISTNLCNIGAMYNVMGNLDKALEYESKALAIDMERKDTDDVALDLTDMGEITGELGNSKKSLELLLQALDMNKKISDKEGISMDLKALGDLYEGKDDLSTALDYFFKALAITREIGNKNNVSEVITNIGDIYILQKKYKLAGEYLDSSLNSAKKIGERENMKAAYLSFSSLDSATGNFKKAFADYKEYLTYRDSLLDDAEKKKMMQSQMNYEFKIKVDSTKAEQDKLNLIAEKESQHQKMLLYSFIGGFIIMLALASFIFVGYRQKQKSNVFITQQKELVEGKNKEIFDSLTYAKRLQEAILPPIGLIKKTLPESFVLYSPKDIVAGDFYWMERAGDNTLIAAADCTGHGVPGALVSVICSNALNRTVKEFHITEPGKILDKVTELVLETFEKSESNVQDGMDISLCCINTRTNEIQWSAANNPLWYITNGEMHEVNADKQPIGKSDKPQPFTTHNLKLQKGDTLYLFTDGYADQFGGPKGKKFKYKQLQEILLTNVSMSMEEQKTVLEGYLDDWKGDLEQVDDILILGLRV